MVAFGTSYEGRKVDGKEGHYVWIYPISYFLRRAILIACTVFLIDHPDMAMIVHLLLTMATLVYISRNEHMFESKTRRFIEIASEMLLLFVSILLQQ